VGWIIVVCDYLVVTIDCRSIGAVRSPEIAFQASEGTMSADSGLAGFRTRRLRALEDRVVRVVLSDGSLRDCPGSAIQCGCLDVKSPPLFGPE
jgi:hypothetical protein